MKREHLDLALTALGDRNRKVMQTDEGGTGRSTTDTNVLSTVSSYNSQKRDLSRVDLRPSTGNKSKSEPIHANEII
jgi:hypothetical protein